MVVRHDDFDFRLTVDEYIAVHELFVKAQVTETAVLQFAQFGHLNNFQEEALIIYMNTTPYWDFQIHGWQHEEYDKMDLQEVFRDLSACKYLTKRLFNKEPTIWYTPWNRKGGHMEEAAKMAGLTISNESNDIQKFIREVEAGIFTGTTVYFHAWNKDERAAVPKMLEMVKTYEGYIDQY